jgi:hyperosmotically inducible periplasmic protein
MKFLKFVCLSAPLLVVGSIAACSDNNAKSPDVTDSVRKSLDQAGLKDVSVSQDRDKGVVSLSGTVLSEGDKAQAESIARNFAGSQVVSDQISVRPPGDEEVSKKVDSDLDKGIEKNLHAALLKRHLADDVKYDVKNGVVTLDGKVHSQFERASVEKLAKGVPNVNEVVNELEVKGQKATASN